MVKKSNIAKVVKWLIIIVVTVIIGYLLVEFVLEPSIVTPSEKGDTSLISGGVVHKEPPSALESTYGAKSQARWCDLSVARAYGFLNQDSYRLHMKYLEHCIWRNTKPNRGGNPINYLVILWANGKWIPFIYQTVSQCKLAIDGMQPTSWGATY